MPKTNLCKPQKDHREAEVKALIGGGIARHDLTQNSLARKAKIAESTMSNHYNNPGEMRLKELWAILDILKPEEYEKARIL